MPEAEKQSQAGQGQVQEQSPDDFMRMMTGAVGARSDAQKESIRSAVSALAAEVLKGAEQPVSEDVVQRIKSIIAEIDRKLSEQINLIIHHEDFKRLEGSWR